MPFSFHESVLDHKDLIENSLAAMNKDLGCVEFVPIDPADLLDNSFMYGVLFVDASATPASGGCFSAYGKAPGFSGGNGAITLFGAQADWQIISLSATDNC